MYLIHCLWFDTSDLRETDLALHQPVHGSFQNLQVHQTAYRSPSPAFSCPVCLPYADLEEYVELNQRYLNLATCVDYQ